MASRGYINSLLNKLPADQRTVFTLIFDEVLRQFRLGTDRKAENLAWFEVESTTASVANTEFSILHGMSDIPTRFIPSLKLDSVGAQLVPLVVSRAADARRVYFKSSSTSAVIQGHFE